jgi:hypothetical protein
MLSLPTFNLQPLQSLGVAHDVTSQIVHDLGADAPSTPAPSATAAASTSSDSTLLGLPVGRIVAILLGLMLLAGAIIALTVGSEAAITAAKTAVKAAAL